MSRARKRPAKKKRAEASSSAAPQADQEQTAPTPGPEKSPGAGGDEPSAKKLPSSLAAKYADLPAKECMSLVGRALEQSWDVPEAFRSLALIRARDVLVDPTSSHRNRIAAGKLLDSMTKTSLDAIVTEIKAQESEKLKAQVEQLVQRLKTLEGGPP